MQNKKKTKKLIKILKISENAILPNKATQGSAGFDLCACLSQNIEIKPQILAKIPCGVAINLPDSGHVAFIFARSGLALNHGITLANGVGVIDSDYRGEICVGLINLSQKSYIVKNNDRVAQLIVLKQEMFEFVEAVSLDVTERGDGGFGSSGR